MRNNRFMLDVVIFNVLLHYCAGLFNEKNGRFKHANDMLQECARQHLTSENEMLKNLLTSYDAPSYLCAWACFFKRMDVLDRHGMYNVDVVKERLPNYFNNEKERELLLTIAKDCVDVNSEPVSDGALGCDRAMLLLKCILKDVLTKENLDQIKKTNHLISSAQFILQWV